MKQTLQRLILTHLAVLALAIVACSLLWGVVAGLSSMVGVLSFSLPLIGFSFMVLQAPPDAAQKFLARFLVGELLKWVASASLLAVAFVVGVFHPLALLVGFLASVLVQLFIPIFVPKESAS